MFRGCSKSCLELASRGRESDSQVLPVPVMGTDFEQAKIADVVRAIVGIEGQVIHFYSLGAAVWPGNDLCICIQRRIVDLPLAADQGSLNEEAASLWKTSNIRLC